MTLALSREPMDQTRFGLSIRKSQAFFADFQYVGMGATLVRIGCLASELNGVEDPPQS
jgi:hypothetical protein